MCLAEIWRGNWINRHWETTERPGSSAMVGWSIAYYRYILDISPNDAIRFIFAFIPVPGKPLCRTNSRSRCSSCSRCRILTRFLRFRRISRHANGSIVDRQRGLLHLVSQDEKIDWARPWLMKTVQTRGFNSHLQRRG